MLGNPLSESVRRIKIRNTHPALYRALMVLSSMKVLLAFNFWLFTPTFNPYGVSKDLIGVIFFLLGFSQIVFLNIFHDLRMARRVLASSVSFMFLWGASNAQQSFAGNASFQLPLLYVAISIMQIPLLIEAPVNPMTEKE